MKMVTEDYVSFEIAKLLKEKGFESDNCHTAYDENGNPIETVDNANAAGFSPTLTGTWQTINKKVYGQISAKWLIIIIMLALAGVLALYRPARKRSKR